MRAPEPLCKVATGLQFFPANKASGVIRDAQGGTAVQPDRHRVESTPAASDAFHGMDCAPHPPALSKPDREPLYVQTKLNPRVTCDRYDWGCE